MLKPPTKAKPSGRASPKVMSLLSGIGAQLAKPLETKEALKKKKAERKAREE